jgi:hypothetical protein
LYDFTGAAENCEVTFIADVVKEPFFSEALSTPDLRLVIVVGHSDINSNVGVIVIIIIIIVIIIIIIIIVVVVLLYLYIVCLFIYFQMMILQLRFLRNFLACPSFIWEGTRTLSKMLVSFFFFCICEGMGGELLVMLF